MQLLQWLLCSCVVVVTAHTHAVSKREAPPNRVVCYYTNWSVYRPGTAKFSPQNINPYLCTHLIYAFGGLSRENGLRPYDKYQDIEQGGYAKFTGLKTYNKELKTMLAIGGWNEGSARFSSLVADEERRAEFVKNVVRFLRQNRFDGLDLDWEYPAFRDGGKPRDRDNYALLVQELREEFDREHSKTHRPRLLLTMAVPAGIEYIDKGYDIPKLNRYLDFMNILSYDYHSAFEPSVNHHSPLYPLEEENEYNFDTQLCIDFTVKHLVEQGADRDKLVVGIPTYGRSYTLFNPDATDIGAPADGPGEQGDATREKGYLAYYEICENLEKNDWEIVKPNPSAMGPYAYKGNQWVGYDDEDIVRLKAKYVSENGLGGIMFWAIDNDDFRGKCHGRPYPLIEAGKEAMLTSNGLTNEVTGGSSVQTTKVSQRPRTNSQGGSGSRNRGRKRKNKGRSTTTTTTTTTRRTTAASSTTPKYVTPEPPTTPDPGSDFKCKDEGFFPHPRDCKKYFWCLDSGPSNLGIVAHQFTCPSGLVFNKAADSCDYARNVICKTKTKSESTTTRPPTTTSTTTSRPTSRTTRHTTTTTTTTTTTPPPEEEEYEEYEDEEEGGAAGDEEDPKVIQELINLIKKLGGVEQLERQLQQQEKTSPGESGSSGISRSLYNKVLGRTTSGFGRGAVLYGTTTPSAQEPSTRYTSIFRNRPRGPQNEGLAETPAKFERPKYVTIQRNRPSTTAPEAEDEDDLDDEDYELEDDEEEEEAKPEVVKPVTKTSSREYVNIRRERPQKSTEDEVTSPKYTTIQRQRPTPEEVNEPVDQDIPETTAISLSDDSKSKKDELPDPTQDSTLENPPKETPTPKRPSRLNIINKKGRKVTEVVQEVEKETEAPVVKVSAERQYLDAASIRSGPRTSYDLSEHDEITTALPLTNDALSTTHRQLSKATVDQVSDIPFNNHLDVFRFRSTTDKPSIYLDDQSLPSISPVPSEYNANNDDEHELNIVVARSPAPDISQIDNDYIPNSTSLPLTTPKTNADTELQRQSTTTAADSDRSDSFTIPNESTEATLPRRRGTTSSTTSFPSSTTPRTKSLSRHSFLPRRRSTTVATTAVVDQISLSTSDYLRDIQSTTPKKGLRPQHHFYPKLRRNSTLVIVNASGILTPSPVTTESSASIQYSQLENTDVTENQSKFKTLTGHQEDYSNIYLTTTDSLLDVISNVTKDIEDGSLKPTSKVLDSENADATEKSTTLNNASSLLLPESDNTPPTSWYENSKELNPLTEVPKVSYGIHYASVTDYSGLSPTGFPENAQENATIDGQRSIKHNVNSLLQPDEVTPTSWPERDNMPGDVTFRAPLTSSEEKNSSSETNESQMNLDQSFTGQQQKQLHDIQSSTTTTLVAPTEFDFNSETTPATVIETVPPPTSTRFTPTVTRVVTSVTESGTTERQRIAVNRVPYRSLIAAMRAKQLTPAGTTEQYETTYPSSIIDNVTETNIVPATTPEPITSRQRFRYITTADVFSGPPEPKIEKIMEVNRITTVTGKQDTQSFFTKHYTREQTTVNPDVHNLEIVTTEINTNEYFKHGKNISDDSSESLLRFENTDITTTETGILPTAEIEPTENNKTVEYEAISPTVGIDGKALINDSYFEFSTTGDITSDVPTEATSTTSSTTHVSTLVERARTRSSGFRRRTTERAYISRDRETSSPANGFRKALRSRNRHYKPSTTVAPSETEDPLLVKLRKANRPLNTSRSDGIAARKPGSFSRRRIYRPSSTTENSIVEESNNNGDALDNSNGLQRGYTRSRVYRLPSKSTTEKIITHEVLTTDQNYLEKEISIPIDAPTSENLLPIEITTVITDEYSLANSTSENVINQTSTQSILEGSFNYSSEIQDADNISSDKTLQDNYYSTESTTDSFKTKTSSIQSNVDYSDFKHNSEQSTSTPVAQPTYNLSQEPNRLTTQESIVLIPTDSSIAITDSIREFSTDVSDITDTERPVSTFVDEVSSPNPPVKTKNRNHEHRVRNFSPAPVTRSNDFGNDSRPTARPQRRKMIIKKRRRRPTEEVPTGVGGNKDNEVDHLSRNYKEDKDIIPEKGESLAALEDTNRNFISTESSLSAEFYTTADENGDHYVKLSILNKLNHNSPGHIPVTGSDYVDTSDYSDYDKYSSRESYDSKPTTDPVNRYTSRFTYSSSETSNEVQDGSRVPLESSSAGQPSRKTFARTTTSAYEEITDTTSRPEGRGRSRFQTYAKTSEKDREVSRRRKVVRKKLPEAVADAEIADEEASVVNITSSRALGRQRQPGTLFSPRQRQRATTTTPPPTTAAPSTRSSTASSIAAQRRVVRRRKYGPRSQATTESTSTTSAEVSSTQEAVTTTPARRPVFPLKRRGNESSTTAPTPLSDAVVQPSALVEETQEPAGTTTLPDLAHPAVAALAQLATQLPPHEEPAPAATTSTSVLGGGAEASLDQDVPDLTSPSLPARPTRILPVRRLPSKSTTTAAPPTSAPLKRQPLRPRPFARIASPAPKTSSSRTPAAASRPPRPPTLDYDYYDDTSLAEASPGSSKVKVHDDGYIECLDQGNFPHPYSCKKFISCAKMESGGLLGWEYTCPRQLSFDPVGGICNWNAGLGCKE